MRLLKHVTLMFFCCSVDATQEPQDGPVLGRLVNHARPGNAQVRVIELNNCPHVCLFATKDIIAGQQILYDYCIKIPFVDKVRFNLLPSEVYLCFYKVLTILPILVNWLVVMQ